MCNLKRALSAGLAVAASVLLGCAGAADAGQYKSLYYSNDTAVRSDLLVGMDGSLYGIAQDPNNDGPAPRGASIFRLIPAATGQSAWSYSTIYTFAVSEDDPTSLVMDKTGSLYCTTDNGGQFNVGALFKLTRPSQPQGAWSKTVLYDRFGEIAGGTASSNGSLPQGPIYINSHGAIYGIARYGVGVAGRGGIYRLSPPATGQGQGTYSIIAAFDPATGIDAGPNGLFVAHDGSFFGTGETLDATSGGSVWRLPPTSGQAPQTVQVVDIFANSGPAGVQPSALVADRSLTLFGTNYSSITNGRYDNVGAVYRLRPPVSGQTEWKEDLLYKFSTVGVTDGRAPTGLIESPQGILYGTAQYRGNQTCSNGCGTIFKLTPRDYGGTHLPWSKQDAYQFNTPAAAYPTQLIKGVLANGTFALFGIANKTIFEFVP